MIVFVSTLGVANITFVNSLKIIAEKIPLINKYIDMKDVINTHRTIIWQIRLPRILLAGIVGMGLSVVGVTFQSMFKNPMADPYILGVSSGAALGATLSIVLGLPFINIWAFCGAILTVLFVFQIAKIGSKVQSITLLLAGIAISSMMSSIISVLMIFNRDKIEMIIFWIMGSVSAASWKHVSILFPVTLLGTMVIMLFSRELNVFLVGDDSAKSLGVETDKVKKLLLVISSVIMAFTVSVSGIIGFVGLIIPHAIRLIIGPDHRALVPFSALGGAIFMILCDTIARTIIPPTEIPVGAVTAIFGSPYFIYLLYRSKKKVLG
ncbi:FecCD family ABC transporter permease [Serpentinicella alkaliphila]